MLKYFVMCIKGLIFVFERDNKNPITKHKKQKNGKH